MPNNIIDFSVPFPDYSISRIIFSHEKVTLLCSMRRPRSQDSSSWFMSSRFYKYMKVYFSVCEELSQSHVSNYFYPERRVPAWARALDVHPLQWEDSFTPQDEDPTRPIIFGTTVSSLEELLQEKQLRNQGIFNSVVTDAIAQEQILGDANTKDHYFEVEIPFDKDNVKSHPYEKKAIDVFSLIHIDIESLRSDLNLSSTPNQILSIGGAFKYERCLRRDPNSGILAKIETVPALFKADGSPYTGYAHYHNEPEEAPPPGSPEPYVGWMAGPAFGEMHDRERLNVREVRNNKVVYNLERDPLSYDGTSLNEDNSYNGFELAQQFGLGILLPTELDQLSIGEDLIAHVRSQIGQINLIGEIGTSLYREQIKKTAISSIRNSKFSLCDGGALKLQWFEAPPRTDRPAYVSGFVLNSEDMLVYNSRFGNILKNLIDNTTRDISGPIVDKIMSFSRFHDFKVSRRRVTNLPTINNFSSTSKHEIYDKDEPAKEIIRTKSPDGDNSGFKFLANENAMAEISPLISWLFPGKVVLILRDYDLFDTVPYGTYEYVIDTLFVDGIRAYLVDLYENYCLALKQYKEYVREAQMPYLDQTQSGYYVGNQFSNGLEEQRQREELGVSGNYITAEDRFTDDFIARARLMQGKVNNIVDLYVEALTVFGVTPFSVSLLDPRAEVMSRQYKSELKEKLLPERATLKTIEFFEGLFTTLKSVISKNTFLQEYSRQNILNTTEKEVFIKKDISYPPELIFLSAPTNRAVHTIPKSSVLLEPNIPGIIGGVRISPPNSISLASAFTLRDDYNLSIESAMTTESPLIRNIIRTRRNSIYNMGDQQALSTEQRAEINFRLMARIEGANNNPYIQQRRDPLAEFNQVLMRYKGITFNSMASRAILTSPEEQQVGKDTDFAKSQKHMSDELQSTILNSIIRSKSKEHFVEHMENEYKDFYYTKKGLGNLFTSVQNILSVSRVLSLNVENIKPSFKDAVLNGTTLNSERDMAVRNITRGNSSSLLDTNFVSQRYVPDSGLMREPARNSDIVVYVPEFDLPEGVYMVNNVLLPSGDLDDAIGATPRPTTSFGVRTSQIQGQGVSTSGPGNQGSGY